MSKLIDLTGRKFGRLTVVERAGQTNQREARWLCICFCGATTTVRGYSLRSGGAKSCGCRIRMSTPDLVGQRFSRLTVVKQAGRNKHGAVTWNVQCDCGASKTVLGAGLRGGSTKSCGCLKREMDVLRCKQMKRHATKHGYARRGQKSSEYASWISMIQRTGNPNHQAYRDYGGRGITVCERWRGDRGLENFIHDLGPRPPGKSLDRKNNNLGYSPENCRYATPLEQAQNRRPRKRKPQQLSFPLYQTRNSKAQLTN